MSLADWACIHAEFTLRNEPIPAPSLAGTALYHLAKTGPAAAALAGIPEVIADANITEVPKAAIGVFVGNAWDPQPGRETPWLDLAYQLTKVKGIEALGASAKEIPPGTESLDRLFKVAGGKVLILHRSLQRFLVPRRVGEAEDRGGTGASSWGIEGLEGGHGVVFTGGHLHKSFAEEGYRRFQTNAILWAAGVDIPKTGAPVALDAADLPKYLAKPPAKK